MSKLVIVGVGALGSHLALLLRNAGVPLVLVDFDRVEAKNTMSQFHTRMGLGRNKAQALQQSLKGLFGLDATAIPHRLPLERLTIGVAGGQSKVRAIAAALRGRLVSGLITDEVAARGILEG